MTDGKIKALFGDYIPTAETTQVIKDRARNAAKAVEERKMIAFGAVAVDHEGQAHMFFGHDPMQANNLIGGLEVLKFHLLASQNYHDDTPKGPSDEPTS